MSVIVSLLLTVAVTLPASGWHGGRRTAGVFSAIVLFTLGSILCARSETLNELIASRVIQGIGGAMMVPVGRLTVMKIVPREQYMAAMTFVTLPGQIGPLMGPALGGFLVQYASWHWIFPDQYSGGDRRRHRHAAADAQLPNANPTLRPQRLYPAGDRHGVADAGARRPQGHGALRQRHRRRWRWA